jgi:2'-5' RNA ligase
MSLTVDNARRPDAVLLSFLGDNDQSNLSCVSKGLNKNEPKMDILFYTYSWKRKVDDDFRYLTTNTKELTPLQQKFKKQLLGDHLHTYNYIQHFGMPAVIRIHQTWQQVYKALEKIDIHEWQSMVFQEFGFDNSWLDTGMPCKTWQQTYELLDRKRQQKENLEKLIADNQRYYSQVGSWNGNAIYIIK